MLGSHDSDDPFCRDLCVRSDVVIVSVNYRHAPEARFPAAADDAFAALQWIAEHAIELGGIPGQLVVAGWSAGGNLAAVVSQLARDAGGPAIVGQLLITPVTDCDLDTALVRRERRRLRAHQAADGVVLGPLRRRGRSHRPAGARRCGPTTSPGCRRRSSSPPVRPAARRGQAPTPRRWRRPACRSRQLQARGHTHTSLTMVDVILSGAASRAEMADALKGFFKAAVPA